ncbi:hypothetical protein AB0I84_20895 [Streptomyces spectabilis]|uniref:hypothetical protein n=1 Tax=Streptomyces spectabilis TaxID=68270 RepID=UPI0033EB582F
MSQHILRHDGARPTTVKCPECGDIVVYNGNYFCNSFDAIKYDREIKDISLNKGTCLWALPHPATRKKDRNIVEELYYAGHLPEIDYR